MAVIAFSDEEAEIWVMQRRVLAAILELAQSYLDDPSDRQTLVSGVHERGVRTAR